MRYPELTIDAFVERLVDGFQRQYGPEERECREILTWAGRMVLELIAKTDAPYHTMDHTISVALVGQEILRGKQMTDGDVSPRDWLHFSISLLCHDIGYVRGVCRADHGRRCATGQSGKMVTVPPGATDAFLTPYHVDRGALFVRERFGAHPALDARTIARNIEFTRFPVPDALDRGESEEYPALMRAADLIGQLADPDHLHKLPALFREFAETGVSEKLGYEGPDDLLADYPSFFWNQVHRHVVPALRHLAVTEEGRRWTANLYAQVFAAERAAEASEDATEGE